MALRRFEERFHREVVVSDSVIQRSVVYDIPLLFARGLGSYRVIEERLYPRFSRVQVRC